MSLETTPPRERIVTCPGCGGPSVYSVANVYRPFCSDRCKNADLGAWANQEFALAAKPSAEDLFEAPDPLH